MPIEHSTVCGNKGCKKRERVAQADAIPKEWIVLRFLALVAVEGGSEPQTAPITEVFCSWRCLRVFSQHREEEEKKVTQKPKTEKKPVTRKKTNVAV